MLHIAEIHFDRYLVPLYIGSFSVKAIIKGSIDRQDYSFFFSVLLRRSSYIVNDGVAVLIIVAI